ncbi:MAG: NgoMIV family type II restriction endonuclease [Pseudomonadota bacterium]
MLDIRKAYHGKLCADVLGSRGTDKGINIADTSNKNSRLLARVLVEKMGFPLCATPPVGQRAGTLFGKYTKDFIEKSFGRLNHLRPGNWEFSATGGGEVFNYDQYQHLADLKGFLDDNPRMKASLGFDYLVSPDIVIARAPVSDQKINENELLVTENETVSRGTPLRATNQGDKPKSILHASISCKWTMRSDRAQNTRTEALNLIRNRKGHIPHIVAVTLEPLPTRIASIAMGTGDVDCTYHAALYELIEAAKESNLDDQMDMLSTLVEGRRLRDISDLPFDLAS